MNDEGPLRERRSVCVDTVDGAVQGDLHISPRLRTLDDLNLVSKRFVTLHTPESQAEGWQPSAGPLAVNKASILFVRELSAPPPKSGGNFGTFTRAAIRLRVKGFEIEGFVHVPPGGSPMKRLDHDNHPFVSLTTALITSPDAEVMTPFLAVNRNQITSAQVVDPHEQPAAAIAGGTESER
jgi:hypothetical protein